MGADLQRQKADWRRSMRLLCATLSNLNCPKLLQGDPLQTYLPLLCLLKDPQSLMEITIMNHGRLLSSLQLKTLLTKGVSWVPRLLTLGLWGFVFPML